MAKTEEPEASMFMMKTVNDLSQLSTAISTFKKCLDDLHNHVQSISDSLDAAEAADGKGIDLDWELQTLCQTMCSRGLRRYIMNRLSEADRLREIVPPALAIAATDPAKLVLDCVGGFYLQGRKAFSRDSPMIAARSAAILALEFFLLSRPYSESVSASSSIKEDAESVAVAWRKRLITEGKLSEATEADARGLLLFLASFGIPKVFSNEDISTLLHLSNPAPIGNALRQSPHLVSRIPDVIKESMKKGRSIEAMDATFTFGMEDKFSPEKILIATLREAKEAHKSSKKDMQSLTRTKHAHEKHLAALRSAFKCLENHHKDPAKVLPGWQLKELIAKLDKEISDINKMERRAMSKRREGMGASEKMKTQEHKRPRIAAPQAPQRLADFEDRNFGSHVDVNSLYSSLLPANATIDGVRRRSDVYLTATLLYHGSGSDRVSRHSDLYPASTLLSHGSGRTLAEAPPGSRSANALYSSGAQAGIVFTEVPEERVFDRIGNVASNGDSLYASHIVGDKISLDNTGQSHNVIYASPGVGALYGRSLDGLADAIRERSSYM